MENLALKSAIATAPLTAPAWAADNFLLLERGLNGSAGAPIHTVRKNAFARFGQIGIPTPKSEEWKYTNLAQLARIEFVPAVSSMDISAATIEKFALSQTSARLVFVNGHFSQSLSVAAPCAGLQIVSLAEGLKLKDARGKMIENYLAKYASTDHPFVALNTAFIQDGAALCIERGKTINDPIQLLFLTTGETDRIITQPRILIIAEDKSCAQVVETYIGDRKLVSLTNAVTEVVVGENATLDHYKLQLEGANAYHISTIQADVKAYGNFSTHSFNFGSALTRNEVNPVIDGQGINCVLNGLSMGSGEQLIDNHTVLDHAKPHSESRELYKGIYDGKSTGVFCGSIIVRPDAQKTNAIQSNQALLLSSSASINAKPQLKIWADDVKCTHGATIGQLDDDGLFYLRSRGVGKAAARGMLIHAFASDVLTSVKIPQLREMVEEQISVKLGE